MSAGGHIAARLYAVLLRTFPPGHRASYAVEMIDAFERERAARRRAHGPWAALRFTAAACLDLVRAGLDERRRQRRPRDARRFGSVLAFLGRDLMHAARSLARARTFSIVCILSIGIGIGAVVASLLVLRGLTGAPPGVTGERVPLEPGGDSASPM
jgi:hypothetical protein